MAVVLTLTIKASIDILPAGQGARTFMINITFRSHIIPSVGITGFELGKPNQIELAVNTTLGEFIQQLFFQNRQHIGLLAINGQIAQEDRILLEGDSVYIYSLMSGG